MLLFLTIFFNVCENKKKTLQHLWIIISSSVMMLIIIMIFVVYKSKDPLARACLESYDDSVLFVFLGRGSGGDKGERTGPAAPTSAGFQLHT